MLLLITADMISDYMAYRKAKRSETRNNRTVNLEVGLLGRILKQKKLWLRIAESVKRLPEDTEVDRAFGRETEDPAGNSSNLYGASIRVFSGEQQCSLSHLPRL